MKFLAARHIEGIEKWSSLSKWRISYELFKDGKTISKIAEYLALSESLIKDFIYKYKLLLRAITYDSFTKDEKEKMTPLTLQPDKFIRIFGFAAKHLAVKKSSEFDAKSSIISDEKLDEILALLAKKAFLDNTIDTRSTYEDIEDDIDKLLGKNNNPDTPVPNPVTNPFHDEDGTDPPSSSISGTGSKRNLPYFFSGLQFGHIRNNDPDGSGVVRICNELKRMSNSATKYIENFPIATAMLIRSLIEQSFIYHAKKNKTNNGTSIFTQISDNGNPKKLSTIIEKYKKSKQTYIQDENVCDYIGALFNDLDNNISSYLNWVVHRPHEFVLKPESLKELPNEGLLTVINYLIR